MINKIKKILGFKTYPSFYKVHRNAVDWQPGVFYVSDHEGRWFYSSMYKEKAEHHAAYMNKHYVPFFTKPCPCCGEALVRK